MSHCIVVGYAIFIASFSVGLYYAGISMGYLYLMMGVIISSAVLPATLTLTWSGQNKWAVSIPLVPYLTYLPRRAPFFFFFKKALTHSWLVLSPSHSPPPPPNPPRPSRPADSPRGPPEQASLSPILGLGLALIAWLVTARRACGDLGVACTQSNDPMLAGNVVALLSPLVLVPVLTLAFGLDRYDWRSMMEIRQGDDHELAAGPDLDLEGEVAEVAAGAAAAGRAEAPDEFEAEQEKLLRAGRISKSVTVVMTIAFLVLWPMRKCLSPSAPSPGLYYGAVLTPSTLAMYGSGYIFSKQFFTGKSGLLWIPRPPPPRSSRDGTLRLTRNSKTGWVVVGIIWIFCSLFGVGLFPIFEGRRTLVNTVKFIVLDITGKKHPGRNRNVPIEGEADEKSDHESAARDTKILGSKESPSDVTPAEK